MSRKINVYCPLHGTQLKSEKVIKTTDERIESMAVCETKGEAKHPVYINEKDTHSEGVIEIFFN